MNRVRTVGAHCVEMRERSIVKDAVSADTAHIAVDRIEELFLTVGTEIGRVHCFLHRQQFPSTALAYTVAGDPFSGAAALLGRAATNIDLAHCVHSFIDVPASFGCFLATTPAIIR